MQNADWTSFTQLIQQLISGNAKRNTFTRWEMELLLDVQMTPMRRSSRPEVLRRYLKSVQSQLASGASSPQRFARFYECEVAQRKSGQPQTDFLALPRAS